ncbi:MAG: hypothetical protein KAS62_11615, partial [Candidatus Delongbacteria bacterium]|nr:hypothetical protein [Candidatus Delongbacteria bacterium]
MKNKVIAIWFILFFSVTTVFAQFAGGDGSEGDPFQVSNPTELDSVRNYKDSCFIQTADIDMNIAPYNSGLGWGPIGTSSALNQFKGQYDGNNFIIRNLYISRDDESDIGMFGYCNGSILKDITLEDVNILGYSNVGALVGNNNNFSSLVNCRMSGSVSGGVRVGGLVGRSYNYCNLTRCSSSGTVHADGQVGGLMGTCGMYCVVSECFSTSQTSTTGSYAGGLINGFSDYCQMDNCYATGDVLGNNFDIGGLLGGIAASSTVENCYSTGRVTGFAGYIGGLIPSNNSSTVLQSYWDTETSELVVSSDGEGKTTAEMMVEGTYVNWDFSTPVWNIHPLINGGYPFLDWQGLSPFPGGDGTVENPYQISNPEELNEVRNYPDAYFIQTADIDLGVAPWNEGTGWLPICDNTNMFTGNYNGDHYFINNLTINRPSDQNVGLFGYASESELYNINIENCNITGDMTIGALAGYHRYNSTISDCYSTGVINGSSFVGGLVGYHFNNATINSSYSTCEINVTTAQSGGLVGYSDIADIYDSYAMGAVNGNN